MAEHSEQARRECCRTPNPGSHKAACRDRQIAVAAVVKRVLIESGAAPGSSIHSWRCEEPERYGPCACVEQIAAEVATALGSRPDSQVSADDVVSVENRAGGGWSGAQAVADWINEGGTRGCLKGAIPPGLVNCP